jgi:hypothetical protein
MFGVSAPLPSHMACPAGKVYVKKCKDIKSYGKNIAEEQLTISNS